MKLYALLLVPLLLVGCSTASPRDYARENGEKLLMDSGSYSALIQRYQQELKESPDPEVRHKLANAHYLVGDVEAAMFQLSQISPRERNTAELALLRANVFFDQGKMLSAEQNVNTALRLDKELGEAHNLQGLILADNGDLKAARSAFESARKFNFDDATVKNNLAMIAILEGDFGKAIETLLPLVKSGRADDVTKANLVLAFAKAGRTRAFSQMLPGSEEDVLLAEKFESLHHAKIHHAQLISEEKLSSASASQTELGKTPISQEAPHKTETVAMTSIDKPQPKKSTKEAVNVSSQETILASDSPTSKLVPLQNTDPLQLARERVKAAKEKALAAKREAELVELKKKKAKATQTTKTNKNKRSRRLITAFQYQPSNSTKDGSTQYVATSDFQLGKVRTMYLEDRNKWVFDVKGAKDFTVKRKRVLSDGPAKIIELGEHKNYVRIVLTLRENTKGKPSVIVDGKTLTIRWGA